MGKINNKPAIDDPVVNGIRNAIEHRAAWFYLLLDEAGKSGADIEKIGRAAIHRCGCIHGREKIKKNIKAADDLQEFLKVFADETGRKVFEMEVIENTENELYLDFHYCPLVSAWQKIGAKEDDIALLCDIAMDGDRGIVSEFEKYRFNLEGAIAKGDPVCKIRIEKK